jgi:flagellar motor switch protein FliM
VTEIELSEASILRLQPGDVVALKVAVEISTEQAYRIQEQWKAAMGRLGHDDVGVVVLAPGIDLTVVRPA